MSSHHKLSLRTAILINLNVMVGFGIFINTIQLAKLAGFIGFLSYALVACLVLPLIISIAALFRLHPDGGFYIYAAKTIHPCAGFMSSWVYFTGKLASASLIIHVVMTLFQSLIPALQSIPTLILDIIVIMLFTILNTFHMRIGGRVAGWFIALKLTPIIFAIVTGLYLITVVPFATAPIIWTGIPSSIPFVVYAFTGFEAACSLSRSIENAERNGPKAIYISFALAVCINIIYQFLFFAATQGAIIAQENYLGAFPTLLASLLPQSPQTARIMVNILHLALASSALGGSYGILFSNHWNLHILAEHNHTFFKSLFTKLNKNNIPVAGVITEALLCIAYLLLTQGNQVPLQQLSTLGSTIAYTLSVLGLIAAKYTIDHTRVPRFAPYLALVSCFLFILTCIRNFMHHGAESLIFFTIISAFGLFMYYWTSTHLKRQQSN